MKKHLKIVFLTLILLIILITSVQAIAPKVSTSLYKYEEIINEYEIWVVREVILAIVLIILIAVLTARKKKDSTKNYKGIKIAIGLIAAVMIIGSIYLKTGNFLSYINRIISMKLLSAMHIKNIVY